mmetsp:Transcript_45194/g.130916  ORF Transcript_45194/g.130916 Transcript_45194/m.130916 type:complete len:352 (+) Transcript_45194:19-1074(+)
MDPAPLRSPRSSEPRRRLPRRTHEADLRVRVPRRQGGAAPGQQGRGAGLGERVVARGDLRGLVPGRPERRGGRDRIEGIVFASARARGRQAVHVHLVGHVYGGCEERLQLGAGLAGPTAQGLRGLRHPRHLLLPKEVRLALAVLLLDAGLLLLQAALRLRGCRQGPGPAGTVPQGAARGAATAAWRAELLLRLRGLERQAGGPVEELHAGSWLLLQLPLALHGSGCGRTPQPPGGAPSGGGTGTAATAHLRLCLASREWCAREAVRDDFCSRGLLRRRLRRFLAVARPGRLQRLLEGCGGARGSRGGELLLLVQPLALRDSGHDGLLVQLLREGCRLLRCPEPVLRGVRPR